MVDKIDLRDHSPAALKRPVRSRTTTIIVHHLAPPGGLLFGDAVAFFTKDPEGVATVTLGGPYAKKVPTINEWKKTGIPADKANEGFVPYHFLVQQDGQIARMLDLAAIGAHASDFNDRSIAVCFLGTFTKSVPPLAPEAQMTAGIALITDIAEVYGTLRCIGHDKANEEMGLPKKGCPGGSFPMSRIFQAVPGVHE